MWHRSIVLLFVIFLSSSSMAAQASLEQKFLLMAQDYLNNFSSLKADFAQNSNEGHLDVGKLYIKKPGRFRFSYENKLLIISTGDTVIYIDKEFEKTYFLKLKDTAFYLLSKRIDFKNPDLKIAKIDIEKNYGTISISSNKIEGHNLMRLRFIFKPLALVGIDIIQQGRIVNIDLYNLILEPKLDDNLFIYRKIMPSLND